MAGGFAPAATGGHKIKGGRWTVFRFFLVSVAFTSTWVAVSSQLGYYRNIHGPAVLLQLNIAYFLPSIPLLIVSAFLDRPLEARLGVAKTILVRLLLGLLGYGAVTAWFPFMPERIWYLLGAVVALGLFSGIAFSASYQLVARFANKNVIALGLGCSASGPLVLAMQLALRMGPTPTRQQQILLFEIIALVIVAGLWATASLLLRHWRSIEHAAGKQALTEPLLSPRQQEQHPEGEDLHPALSLGTPATPAAAAIALVAAAEEGMPLLPSPRGEAAAQTSPRQLLAFGESLWKQRSLPPLVAYSSLEPYQSPFLTNDQELEAAVFHASWAEERSALTEAAEEDEDGGASDGVRGRGLARGQGRSERQLSAPPAVLLDSLPEGVVASPYAAGGEGAGGPGVPSFKTSVEYVSADGEVSHPAGHVQIEAAAAVAEAPAAGEDVAAGGSTSWRAFKLIWAPLAALSLSSTVALTLFPFFTYVPASGLLGETLPKVLFFVRIFADVLGRFLPRLSLLAAQSPLTPLLVAGAKLAGVPILLLYLKSPEPLHSDVFAVFLIALIWVLGGYINTMSNMLAPRLAPPQLKGAAAGLMAIAYQAAHFVGLALATLLVYLMYGHIGVE